MVVGGGGRWCGSGRWWKVVRGGVVVGGGERWCGSGRW